MGNVATIFALSKASLFPSTSRILMKCLPITDLGNGVLGRPCYIAVILKIQEEFTCENISEVLVVFSTFRAFLTTGAGVVPDSISYRSGPLPRHAFASEI